MALDLEEFNKQRKMDLLARVTPALPLMLSVISFWSHYRNVFNLLINLLGHFLFGTDLELDLSGGLGKSIAFVSLTTFMELVFYLLWLFLLSRQALLPAHSMGDVIRSMAHLSLHIFNLHGLKASIRDGKLDDDPDDLRRRAPGVVVLDHNSAMVLERVTPAFGLPSLFFIIPRAIWDWLKIRVSGSEPRKAARVLGPGLSFLRTDERILGVGDLDESMAYVDQITGVVDIRRQFRTSGQPSLSIPGFRNEGVKGYTRDGIELTSSISTFFTVGVNPNSAPHVLHVTYRDGIPHPDQVCVVNLSGKDGSIGIGRIEDSLDEGDRQYIHEFLQDARLSLFTALKESSREPIFNHRQVFSAVYARARNHGDDAKILPWTELPVHVAIDHFREILSTVNFDELYQLDGRQRPKVAELRQNFGNRIRNMGVLSVRFVFRSNNRPLKEGESYPADDLLVSEVITLTPRNVLRDRGIQIMSGGFGELTPNEEVFAQWLANWGATWERDTIIMRAQAELEAKRLRNRSRAIAQNSMANTLETILANTNQSLEATALLVLQALEDAASDESTRRLLPEETINLLNSLYIWLNQGELPPDVTRFGKV